jgi:hypothetical protein
MMRAAEAIACVDSSAKRGAYSPAELFGQLLNPNSHPPLISSLNGQIDSHVNIRWLSWYYVLRKVYRLVLLLLVANAL